MFLKGKVRDGRLILLRGGKDVVMRKTEQTDRQWDGDGDNRQRKRGILGSSRSVGRKERV